MHDRLERLVDNGPLPASGDHVDILDAYRMFAHDRGWPARMRGPVANGLRSETPVQRSLNDKHARMGWIADPYLRERLLDFEAIADELLQTLSQEGAD